MNKQDIEQAEKNKVIAEFMGWESYEDRYGIWFKKEGLIKCLHIKLQELKYHTDWSSLMPVWFKFRDLRFQEELHQFRHSDLKELISRAICYEDIEMAHQRLFEAIEWYNENVKNHSGN